MMGEILVDLACYFVGVGDRVVVNGLKCLLVFESDGFDGIYVYPAHPKYNYYTLCI